MKFTSNTILILEQKSTQNTNLVLEIYSDKSMHTQTFATRVIFHQPTFLCFSYFLLAYNYNKTGDLYVPRKTREEVFFLSFYLFCFKNNGVLNLVRSSFHLPNAQAMNYFLQLPLYKLFFLSFISFSL